MLDRLERAYRMEEEMAGMLIEFCQPEALPEDLPADARQRIKNILLSIKSDTLRHRDVVAEAKRRLSL